MPMELETPRLQPDSRRPTPVRPARTSPASSSTQSPSQRDLAFKTFGVMDTGKQNKKSVAGALILNTSLLIAAIAISLTAKKMVTASKVTPLTAPIPVHHEPPPEPKPVPKLPPPPVVRVTPPTPLIKPPVVEVPEPPKVQPPVFKAAPTPTVAPAPPKAVSPPPAPKPVAIAIAQAASVPNNSAHPSPIRVGSMTNPINNTSGPAVSAINLGRSGAPGMNAGNTGLGNPSKIAIGGSGSPNGSNMAGRDNAVQPIKGLSNGIPGAAGPLTGKPAGAIQIASNATPLAINNRQAPGSITPPKTSPKVMYKPRPEYTEDARANHIEGTVYVKIHVTTAGSVQVVGVSSGLGHGLDQQALRVAAGMKFQPALSEGKPVEWDGIVNVTFQLAS